jgi:uncharacterized protein YdeI (YjbR/CyaY-like superfamily)
MVNAMPEPDATKIKSFKSPKELGRWLKTHHATQRELWVKVYKKGSQTPSVTWNDIVIQTLCWGWIDGVRKSLDDESFLQRITPRGPRSSWSKRNTEHVERLIAEGLMQPAGLVQVQSAKDDGRWERAYAPPSQLTVPDDFVAALEGRSQARKFFETLGKSSRYVIACGLTTAKKPETRQRRFDKYMEMLTRSEAPSFGFGKGKKK